MIKSPLNYIGGKYRILPQILPLFPSHINHFVDMFAGGLDVSLNVNAQHVLCNDINHHLIAMYQYLQNNDIDDLLKDINNCIRKYHLTKMNAEGFYKLRDDYNFNRQPLLLFLLTCYGFNHQIRFNGNGEFNNPFGKNRSSYNQNIENNLIAMHTRIKKFTFCSLDYSKLDFSTASHNDFVYADPPYLISCGTYNDGKRGFKGWSIKEETTLFDTLDQLDRKGISFAMSNVIKHKGEENGLLAKWCKNYKVHDVNIGYGNSNYQAKKSDTHEILITNY